MSYYVTMDGPVQFRSPLPPDMIRETAAKLNKESGREIVGYGNGNPRIEFTIEQDQDDVAPEDKNFSYLIKPYAEDYYFNYHEEKIQTVVDFLKTVVARDNTATMVFKDNSGDIWGFLVKNRQVYGISYKLVVHAPDGEEDLDKFE
jgi:hypothetical protein